MSKVSPERCYGHFRQRHSVTLHNCFHFTLKVLKAF